MERPPKQLATLERLHKAGYEILAFPMCANSLGIRKANRAALPALATSQNFAIHGTPPAAGGPLSWI